MIVLEGSVKLTAALPGASTAPRRWSGAFAVVGGLVVLVLLAATLSATVRHQLALSFTRVQPSYAELWFTGGSASSLVCSPLAVARPLRFTVGLHGGTRSVAFRLEVRRPGSGSALRQASGSVRGSEGAVVTRLVPLSLPAGVRKRPYDVRVSLVGTKQALVAHCPGSRR